MNETGKPRFWTRSTSITVAIYGFLILTASGFGWFSSHSNSDIKDAFTFASLAAIALGGVTGAIGSTREVAKHKAGDYLSVISWGCMAVGGLVGFAAVCIPG